MSTVIPPPDLQMDVDRGYRQWHIREIYVPGGTGRYVPNVDDLVLDYTNGWMRVISVDYTTGVSIREPWLLPTISNNTDEDLLVGSGPGYTSESFRCFLNTAVMPYTLTCDKRLHLYGSEAAYLKIFRGTDISSAGQVVSAFYDQSNQFIGEDIPLEVVAMEQVHNTAIKSPKTGYTSYQMVDGEVVTAVSYSAEGRVTSISRMLIMNSSFVHSPSDASRYITGISIESPFLSPSDPQTIQYPINMPVQNLNLMGVVTYSDGSQRRLPVDGTKFEMHGLDEYIATVAGEVIPFVLSYKLDAGEYSYIVNPSINNHISVVYRGKTMEMDGAYSIKLFCTPVWIDQLNGYRLEWYLYNLLRDDFYNVTNNVVMATGSSNYDPILYGTIQHLSVAVNLKSVDPRFANYRHVQNVQVLLKAMGTDGSQDNWNVIYTPGQDPAYGVGTKALSHFVNTNNYQVDISCGCTTLEEWLAKVYRPTLPLVDDHSEVIAPDPNYVLIRSGSHEVEAPISRWNSTLQLHEVPSDGGVIYLHFIRRNASTDLQLSVAGLIVHSH